MGFDGRRERKRDSRFVVNYNGRHVYQTRKFNVSLVLVKDLITTTREEDLVVEMCKQNKKKKNQEV